MNPAPRLFFLKPPEALSPDADYFSLFSVYSAPWTFVRIRYTFFIAGNIQGFCVLVDAPNNCREDNQSDAFPSIRRKHGADFSLKGSGLDFGVKCSEVFPIKYYNGKGKIRIFIHSGPRSPPATAVSRTVRESGGRSHHAERRRIRAGIPVTGLRFSARTMCNPER